MREMKGLAAGASAQKRANAVIPSSLDATAINSSSELQGGAATLNRPSPSPCKVPGTSGLKANLVWPAGEGLLAVSNSTSLHDSADRPSNGIPPSHAHPGRWLVLFWKLSTALARLSFYFSTPNKRR